MFSVCGFLFYHVANIMMYSSSIASCLRYHCIVSTIAHSYSISMCYSYKITACGVKSVGGCPLQVIGR